MEFLAIQLAFIEGIGGPEMVLILVIVLVLFGGQKLPEFARGLGKSIREFKKAASGVEEEFKRALEEDAQKKLAPPVPTTFPPYPPAVSHDEPTAVSHDEVPAASHDESHVPPDPVTIDPDAARSETPPVVAEAVAKAPDAPPPATPPADPTIAPPAKVEPSATTDHPGPGHPGNHD